MFRLHPSRTSAFRGVSDLSSIVSNMELELDATQYSGSGDWLNIIDVPDSGAGKTDNNFAFAASTNDPNFNVDIMEFDGDDQFNHAVDTTFMDEVNFSTNCQVTFIYVFDKGVNLTNADYFFSTGNFSPAGVGMSTKEDGDIQVFQSSGGTGLLLNLAIGLSINQTDDVLIVSFDASGSRVDVWYNSKTPVSATGLTFDTNNGTNSSTQTATIGANISSQWLPSGDAMTLFAIRNKETTDAEAESIIDALSDRGLISPIA